MGLGPSIVNDIELNSRLDPAYRPQFQSPQTIRRLLGAAKTIAIVGLSTEPTKASNMVGHYLMQAGYRVIPVHPKADQILGQKAYRRLADIPDPVDIVNAFRPSDEVPAIVDEAISIGAKAVWTQFRIIDIEAGLRAIDAGLDVVMDRCIKVEHGRYCGKLHWAGMNTEVVSAKRPAPG